MTHHPAGEPDAVRLEQELADVQAEDGSIWAYDAPSGGYISSAYPDVICRDAAAVAAHASPETSAVWQAPINHEENR